VCQTEKLGMYWGVWSPVRRSQPMSLAACASSRGGACGSADARPQRHGAQAAVPPTLPKVDRPRGARSWRR